MQVVNLHTNKVSRILGKVENNERFLRIALYQGDKGNKKVRKIPALAANVNDTKEPLSDPTLLCCAFKKHRIYTFRYATSSILGEYFIGWCPVPSSEFLFMHVISWKFDAMLHPCYCTVVENPRSLKMQLRVGMFSMRNPHQKSFCLYQN
jgi:hypothetical protein